jgi:formylglycine-generating enzyme required for sulfatase activity
MGTNPSNFKGDNLPVENVSWDDVQEYLKKLNQKTGKKYRLPTEAEWEYAAREGGKKVRFGNGKDIANPSEINFDGSKDYKKPYSVVGVYREKTTNVGSFSPNSLGLYDMSGNVWEWCSDWYSSYSSSAVSNPTGAATGSSRVGRGGGWDSYPLHCRVAYRNYGSPPIHGSSLGFRVVFAFQ